MSPGKNAPPREIPKLKIIGVLESCFQEKFGTPRQPQLVPGSWARLTVYPQYAPEYSLSGLSEFSHVWLISWFHLNTNKRFLPKIHPPRLKGGKIGVFASRSPHRPNSLGLSLVKLERVEKDTLILSGIDLVSGTPILDIKPYLPGADTAEEPRSGWLPGNLFPELKVVFSGPALKDIEAVDPLGGDKFGLLITGALRHDPRNARDRTQMKDGKVLEFFLWNQLVRFSITGNTAVVLRVEAAKKFEKRFRREKPPSRPPGNPA